MNAATPAGQPAATPERSVAVAFLRRDVMGNLPLLKMASTYPGQAQLRFRETDGRGAAMLIMPVAASAFDRATYPKAEWVVMLAAEEPGDVEPLLSGLDEHAGIVFKITHRFAETVGRSFAIQRVTAYVSYTWPADQPTQPDPRVNVSLTTDPLGKKLRAAMPRTLEDVLPFFESGDARLFTIAEGGATVAGCLGYPNFEDVHEVGVLYTAPGFRHRGYARGLVTTAAHDMRGRGLTVRYQTTEDNDASQAVARAAGLVPFLTLEHWLGTRR